MLKNFVQLILLGCFVFLVACSSQKPVVSQRYFWPPLPDRPRIEWIRQYRSQLDIDKSGIQSFMEAIIGEDRPIALSKPVEVKSDSVRNRFYVSDIGTAVVYVFDNARHELRTLPDSTPPIRYPLNIALAPDGSIFVLDRRSVAVLVFDKNEKFSRSITLENIVRKPLAMCFDTRKNRLLIADGASHKIFVMDPAGKQLFTFGGFGDAEGSFNLPIAIAVSSRGDIVVADSFNARIQIFDSNGVFKRAFGTRGDGPGDFQLIKAVAVDSDNNVYVVDGKSHNVKIFNMSGELLMVLGNFYAVAEGGKTAQGGFAIPVAIDIDSEDGIFVADQMNARIQVFRYLSDKYLRDNPVSGIDPSFQVR